MPELIWDGKYDEQGRIVGPPRVALPFQTIETVNQSAQERQTALESFQAGHAPQWRNRLIWGDKKYVLPSLLAEFAGQVDLIYIDPPFATGDNFGYQAQVHPDNGDGNGQLKLDYQPNLIEEIAYRDTWGGGLDTYLKWMYETLVFLRELLKESGSIYVHCDQTAGHYLKGVMDTVFGGDNFRNEIVWHYTGGGRSKSYFSRKHDGLLYYVKTPTAPFDIDAIRVPYKETSGYAKGGIVSRSGKKYTPHPDGTPVDDVWDIPIINPLSRERIGYPTQKPESLLERIIKASSSPDDLVLDCFVGSGTTAAVAEKLGRRWIAAHLGRFAISTTRKRLLAVPEVKPFQVQNLGRYERQAWQQVGLELNYQQFILELYHATPLSGYAWLHGSKAGRLVHIGAVDAPVSLDDVQRVVDEFRAIVGSGADAPTTAGVDILGWDFGLEADTEAKELAHREGINIRLRRIPREVMDSRAVAAGDVRFFELASLSIDRQADQAKHGVTLTLDSFIMPPEGIPAQVREKVTHWSQWIDYWAVDWEYRNDTFNNQWQSYRTRAKPKLKLSAEHTYDRPGKRTVVVKVIDILGNDTTRRLELEV